MSVNEALSTKLSYEDALSQLEDIVKKLEQGDVALEEALLVYQQGIELMTYCHGILNKVEEKLTIIKINREGE